MAGFATAVAAGTGLLMLPVAKAGPGGAGAVDALFTATSAVCVTGLIVVDTPAYWSGFGQAVILALIQVGGFGIMTFASLLVLLVSHRIGLKARLTAAAETKTLGLGDVRSVVTGVVKVSLLLEAVTALVLALRFATAYDEPWPRSVWLGVFHAVSAFNNAGFALYSDNLMGFATDPWVCLPIALAVIAGGLGFPVLFELRRRWHRPWSWSLHTKIVLWASGIFLVGGSAFITAIEWSNPATLGPMDAPREAAGRVLPGRDAAHRRVQQHRHLSDESCELAGHGCADVRRRGQRRHRGGIKVTTFAVLFFVIYAEIRGEGAVNIFHRRLHGDLQRQALTVVLLSVAAVAVSTLAFVVFTDHSLDQSLFETTSAFATVGLSTGITAGLHPGLQLLLVVLMFIGRLGPITVASALALRSRVRLYDLPEERPVIG
ncbi:potassium transporter TrkG [Streptomyces cinereospinus]